MSVFFSNDVKTQPSTGADPSAGDSRTRDQFPSTDRITTCASRGNDETTDADGEGSARTLAA